jgi:peptidoglycan/xylan/chitin deacetylase (PgdA/CDA1 family)
MLRIAMSFDYDSPAGYRESFHMRDFPANADYEGASILLRVLQEHDVKATFGIVGQAALPGEPPENCQEQIQAIHRAGHEIASHSMTHRFLPPLRDAELTEEAAASKRALEMCIGAGVQGFIPPFNRPSHFPRRGAFSFSEMFGLAGRGRGRQSISTMLRILSRAGFTWSRVSFQNSIFLLGCRLRVVAERPPIQPFIHHGTVAIPLHLTGFGHGARALVRRWLGTDLVLTLYGHPNQALAANGQSASELDRFLSELRGVRNAGTVEFNTMGELATLALGERVQERCSREKRKGPLESKIDLS